MTMLKLAALDEEDLTVISACMQDAVLKIGEIALCPGRKALILPVNRFAWEKSGERLTMPERRRSVLHFDSVVAVQVAGIDRSKPGQVFCRFLAVQFEPTEAPAGTIEITFAGGGALRFDVECIEAQLADLGPAWAAKAKPKHGV